MAKSLRPRSPPTSLACWPAERHETGPLTVTYCHAVTWPSRSRIICRDRAGQWRQTRLPGQRTATRPPVWQVRCFKLGVVRESFGPVDNRPADAVSIEVLVGLGLGGPDRGMGREPRGTGWCLGTKDRGVDLVASSLWVHGKAASSTFSRHNMIRGIPFLRGK
jgi:hypothetical protein